MTLRSVLMLLVALILAWVAYVTANHWMASRMVGAGTGDLSRVIAAAVEIPNETKIDASMIKLVEIPPASIPEKAFRDEKAVIGRFADHAIGKGSILTDGLVVERLGGNTLAAKLTPGKRAVTVRSNDVVGVAGFLVAGSKVDLLVTRHTPAGNETQTKLQNLKVLAVGQTASPDKTDPAVVNVVTLEADPIQAEQIVAATQDGNVQFTLRRPDEGIARQPEPDKAAAAAVKPATPPPDDPRVQAVAVIRGTSDPKGQIKWNREPCAELFRIVTEKNEKGEFPCSGLPSSDKKPTGEQQR